MPDPHRRSLSRPPGTIVRCPTRLKMAILQGFRPLRRGRSRGALRAAEAGGAALRAAPGEAGGGDDERSAARAEAERLWPVSADRALRLRPGVRGGVGTPAKAVLRKLMRWYVEPLAYDQRSFNAAALRLIDDLEARVAAARGRAEAAA